MGLAVDQVKGKPVAKYTITHSESNGRWYVTDASATATNGQQKEHESTAAFVEWINGPIDPDANFFVIQVDLKTNYYDPADPTLSDLSKIKDRIATMSLTTSRKVDFK